MTPAVFTHYVVEVIAPPDSAACFFTVSAARLTPFKLTARTAGCRIGAVCGHRNYDSAVAAATASNLGIAHQPLKVVVRVLQADAPPLPSAPARA